MVRKQVKITANMKHFLPCVRLVAVHYVAFHERLLVIVPLDVAHIVVQQEGVSK